MAQGTGCWGWLHSVQWGLAGTLPQGLCSAPTCPGGLTEALQPRTWHAQSPGSRCLVGVPRRAACVCWLCPRPPYHLVSASWGYYPRSPHQARFPETSLLLHPPPAEVWEASYLLDRRYIRTSAGHWVSTDAPVPLGARHPFAPPTPCTPVISQRVPQGELPLAQCCPSPGSKHWVQKSRPSPPEPGPGLTQALGGAQVGPSGPEAAGR